MCLIPAGLPPLSQWALVEWLNGRLTDIGFVFYFSRASSALIDGAVCLTQMGG